MFGYSDWPLRYFPLTTEKPKISPDMFVPQLPMSEAKELDDLQASFSRFTNQLGMQLVEAQNAYVEDCAKKLGISVEELVQVYELESQLKDPMTGGPLPSSSDEYRLVYEFRLVPRRR